MKTIYERLDKMMLLQKELTINDSDFLYQPTDRRVYTKIIQLKTSIEATVHLLLPRSPFLLRLYDHLAHCYLFAMANRIADPSSGPGANLQAWLLNSDKVLTIFKSLINEENLGGGGSSIQKILERHLAGAYIGASFIQEFYELFTMDINSHRKSMTRRYETLLRMTAYHSMVASQLATARD